MVNDNLIDVVVQPTKTGEPATVDWRPRTAAAQVDAQVATVAAGQPTAVTVEAQPDNRIIVRGRIPAGRKPLVRTSEVDDPASFARSLLIESLLGAGVRVAASPLADNRPQRLPPVGSYKELRQVAELTSPPFAESAKLVLKVSHNLHASTLPLLVAAKHGKSSLADGLRLDHEFFKRAGVDTSGVSFGGGAGGARGDYVTPRATVQLLRYMSTRKDFDVYRAGLPILGIDGTLAKAVGNNSPARGKVFAKTGTLLWDNLGGRGHILTSKALAGYLTTAGGRELAIALFVNNVPIDDSERGTKMAGETLGRLCEVLYEGVGAGE
jgi:D-alanyl-D-alanine carboxypeptidase/D-alanyl-D-alanine-endopeptidase (penicillin-binding protein 4)